MAVRRSVLAETVLALTGAGLVVLAIVTNQAWLDRHLHPSFFITRRWYLLLELWARIGLSLTGLLLALVVRRPLGRFAARRPGTVLQAIGAVALAVVAAHYVLTWTRPTSNWLFGGIEPLRRADAQLGWTFVPGRS